MGEQWGVSPGPRLNGCYKPLHLGAKEEKWEASVTLSPVNKVKATSSHVKVSLCRRENWGPERVNGRDWRWTLEPPDPTSLPSEGSVVPVPRLLPPPHTGRRRQPSGPGPRDPFCRRRGSPRPPRPRPRAEQSPRRTERRRQPEKGAGTPGRAPVCSGRGSPGGPLRGVRPGAGNGSAWGGGGGDGGRQGLGRRPGAHSPLPGPGQRGGSGSARRPRWPQGRGDHAH